jgi:hypothetical protein
MYGPRFFGNSACLSGNHITISEGYRGCDFIGQALGLSKFKLRHYRGGGTVQTATWDGRQRAEANPDLLTHGYGGAMEINRRRR